MKKILALTLFFVIVVSFQVTNLVRKKQWRELFVYSLLMGTGIIYSYGTIFDLPLPNPIRLLSKYVKPIYNYIFKELLI